MIDTNLSLHNSSRNYSNCPLNEFCSVEAKYYCPDKNLNTCKYCNVTIVYILFVVYFIMGCAIFMANGMIIAVYTYRYRIKVVAKSDPIRLSLAVADILTGVQIFAMVLPEMVGKIGITGDEHMLLLASSSTKSTWQCGVLLITCFSSSLYHLIIFGFQRLSAITWPLKYKHGSSKSVYISLALVWIVAIFTAAVPGIFPNYYYYCRRSSLCFVCSRSITAYINLYSLFLFFPFFVMTLTSVVTAIVAHYRLKKSKNIRSNSVRSRQKSKTFTIQQVTAFKTVALMQIGFTLTVGPALLGIVLTLLGVSCMVMDPYETACFLLFFTNSLVNAIVYSARDPKFRKTLLYLLSVCKSSICGMNLESDTSPYTISNSHLHARGGSKTRIKFTIQ